MTELLNTRKSMECAHVAQREWRTGKNEVIGRQSLLDIIKTAHTYNDYIGVFWSPINCSKICDQFFPQPLPRSSFNRVLSAATFPEAVDKMVCISLCMFKRIFRFEGLTSVFFILVTNRAIGEDYYMYFMHM